MEQKYTSSKQNKNSRGQSRKKHQSDLNNGLHMNGLNGHYDMRLGSHTISSTKYAAGGGVVTTNGNDYSKKQFKNIDKKSKSKKVNGGSGGMGRLADENIITKENLIRDSYDTGFSGTNGHRAGHERSDISRS